MEQFVQEKPSQGEEATPSVGTPGQPETKRYWIWLWEDGYDIEMYEGATCEEEVMFWFDRGIARNDQQDYHSIERIDDLGAMEDDRPVPKVSEAEFLATVRALKEACEAWRSAHQGPIDEPLSATDESPPPEDVQGRREGRRYRGWYSYGVLWPLECAAENETRAAEWFGQWCEERGDGITTYTLDRIEEMNDPVERPAWESETARPMAEHDFFETLKRMRDAKAKRQA